MIEEPRVTYALTLHRPWAQIVLLGDKSIENRGWKPPKDLIGKRIAIHAGMKFDERGWLRAMEIAATKKRRTGAEGADSGSRFWAMKPGAIVGTAVIDAWIDSSTDGTGWAMSKPGIADLFKDPWYFGPIGWVLTDRRPLATPVLCRGAQKLWRIPAPEAEKVNVQLVGAP